jgi:uncharacterized protein (DUF1501 family)
MKKTIDRRRFLAAAAAAGGPLALERRAVARGQETPPPAAVRRLVVLFQDGGNDALNTLAPVADARYRAARPSLALAAGAALPLDQGYGLHPSLARLAERFRSGGVGFVRGVGYAPPNLSHFTSRDVWGSALLEPSAARSGWVGRTVDELFGGAREATALLAVGHVQAPLAMRAPCNAPFAVPDARRFRVQAGTAQEGEAAVAARRQALQAVNRAGAPGPADRAALSVVAAGEAIQKLEHALEAAPRVAYPESKLARDLSMVARVIEADLPTRAFHVAQGGYDTHAVQSEVHAGLLSDLDLALDAFLRDLAALDRLDATLVLVFTEFGRRVAENGIGATAGTDHGAAGLAFLCGGGAVPGLHGAPWRLDALDATGNLVPAVDFRALYADVIEGWFGLASEPVLGGAFARAGVVRG